MIYTTTIRRTLLIMPVIDLSPETDHSASIIVLFSTVTGDCGVRRAPLN